MILFACGFGFALIVVTLSVLVLDRLGMLKHPADEGEAAKALILQSEAGVQKALSILENRLDDQNGRIAKLEMAVYRGVDMPSGEHAPAGMEAIGEGPEGYRR